jgi:N-acetylmuramoyl-L-alanine amidase
MTNLTQNPQKPSPAAPAKQSGVLSANLSKTVSTIIAAGVVIATLFTLWSPNRIFSDDLLNQLVYAFQSGEAPQVNEVTVSENLQQIPRIGLIAGHWGYDEGFGADPGAVCYQGQYAGITETEINLRVATLVRNNLQQQGFEVDLLEENDPRLNQYQSSALISIHADSCAYVNDLATGFKLSAAVTNPYPEKTNRLRACLIHHYGQNTNLPYHYGSSQTLDMLNYHVFNKVNFETPTVLIETGFMNLDANIVIGQPELVARGITNGILCFIRNESLPEDILSTAQPQ